MTLSLRWKADLLILKWTLLKYSVSPDTTPRIAVTSFKLASCVHFEREGRGCSSSPFASECDRSSDSQAAKLRTTLPREEGRFGVLCDPPWWLVTVTVQAARDHHGSSAAQLHWHLAAALIMPALDSEPTLNLELKPSRSPGRAVEPQRWRHSA